MHLRYRGLLMSGDQGPLVVTEFTPPVAERRSTMVERLNDHGVVTSPEWLEATTWGITLATNTGSLRAAMGMAGEVEARWTNRADMASPAPTALEYSQDGVAWYRIYGRPGRFTSIGQGESARQGVGFMELEFIQTDPLHYSSAIRSTTITTAPAVSRSGWRAPFRFPLTSVETGAARSGTVANGGDHPTPLSVTFHGPAANPSISSGRLRFGYEGSLAYDQQVRIDAHAHTVTLSGGGRAAVQVPGDLTAEYALSEFDAPAGASYWAFQATDQTGTARAVLEWRDAHISMQHGGATETAPPPSTASGNVRITSDSRPYLVIDQGTHVIAQTEDDRLYIAEAGAA